MKVLHLISSEGLYGAENMLLSLAVSLGDLQIDTEVAAFQHSPADTPAVISAARAAGLETALIGCHGRFDPQVPGRIRQRVAQSGADVVHTHGYKADIYAGLACRHSAVPLVSTCHNWPDPGRLMQAYAKLDRLVLRRFSCVTTPSSRVATTLRHSGVPSWTTRVISNGVDVPRFSSAAASRPALDGSRGNVGCVGRLVNKKGGLTALDAAAGVLAAHPAAQLHFVGDGPDRAAWQAYADALGIAGNVHFHGTLSNMPEVYASFDLLVLPSHEEAMPMCVLEGLASHLPTVATAVGEVPRLIRHEETGLLVEPGNAAQLADAIGHLLADPALAHRLAEAGHRLVEAEFSASAMAAQYADVYRHVCSTGGAA